MGNNQHIVQYVDSCHRYQWQIQGVSTRKGSHVEAGDVIKAAVAMVSGVSSSITSGRLRQLGPLQPGASRSRSGSFSGCCLLSGEHRGHLPTFSRELTYLRGSSKLRRQLWPIPGGTGPSPY
nr:hypothetical protein CFP56_57963 [Quercus suber]